MPVHHELEWDPAKARENLAKHGVSFEEAAEALRDEYADFTHVDKYQDVEGEDRWLTLASYPFDRSVILAIVWTERWRRDRQMTRIISARHAERAERRHYEQNIFK